MENRDEGVEIDADELEAAVAETLRTVDSESKEILEEDDSESEATSERDVVLLYKPKCLECKHLFPEGGKKVYSGCHFSKGNDDCPAKELKLVVMIPAERVSDMMFEATMSNDVVRLSELSAKLSRKDPAEVERVMFLLRQKLANHSASSKQ